MQRNDLFVKCSFIVIVVVVCCNLVVLGQYAVVLAGTWVKLGQYGAVLVGTWWYWVIIERNWLIHDGTGSEEGGTG